MFVTVRDFPDSTKTYTTSSLDLWKHTVNDVIDKFAPMHGFGRDGSTQFELYDVSVTVDERTRVDRPGDHLFNYAQFGDNPVNIHVDKHLVVIPKEWLDTTMEERPQQHMPAYSQGESANPDSGVLHGQSNQGARFDTVRRPEYTIPHVIQGHTHVVPGTSSPVTALANQIRHIAVGGKVCLSFEFIPDLSWPWFAADSAFAGASRASIRTSKKARLWQNEW